MKTLYKTLGCAATGAALCLFLASPASAQRTSSTSSGGGHSSGGSGGSVSHSSGGSSVSSPRPSGGSSFSRPSGGSSFNRPSGSPSFNRSSSGSYGGRSSAGAQNNPGAQRPNYVYHNGAIIRNNTGQRQGTYVPNRGVGTANQGVGVRGNYNYPQGVGVRGNSGADRGGVESYRSMPKIGYGGNGYWGTHGYYHYNHGYYNTYYKVRLGYTCTALPYGYYPFFWGDDQYYFSDGLFYTYADDEYTVVDPPVGAEVSTLPDKAQSIVINGQQYYEYNGVYYEPVTKDDGTVVYMVAGKDGVLNTDSQVQDDQPQGPQIGDVVTELPSDCRKIKLNGEVLYVSPDGIYFKEQADANGNKTYKIVGLPSDESDGN